MWINLCSGFAAMMVFHGGLSGIVSLLIVLASIGLASSKAKPTKSADAGTSTAECSPRTKNSGITAYYINLDEHTDRKKMMETQLQKMGIPFKRIPAISPNSPEYNVLMLEQPCKRNTPQDLSVIMSHLKAIYTAVFDPIKLTTKGKPPLDNYALILEDDVRFLYDIDYKKLVDTAPRKFGILQLLTSNPEAVDSLWYNFNVAQCGNASTSVTAEQATGPTTNTAAAGANTATVSAAHTEAVRHACADFPLIEKNYKPKAAPKKKKEGWNEDDYVAPPKQYEMNAARLHDVHAAKYWKLNNWNDFSRNGRSALYWSSQAYLINKRVAWRFLNDIIEFVPPNNTYNGMAKLTQYAINGKPVPATTATAATTVPLNAQGLQMGFKLVNSFTPHACQRRKERPCILASCMFAYSYIFSAGQPTHVSQIPLFTGAKLGLNSTLHADQSGQYKKAFAKIKAITADMKGVKSVLLPAYVEVPSKKCTSPAVGGS